MPSRTGISIVTLGGLILASNLTVAQEPPPQPPQPVPAISATVTLLKGKVYLGAQEIAATRDRLIIAVNECIASGRASEFELQLDPETIIRVSESSRICLRDAEAAGELFELTDGRILVGRFGNAAPGIAINTRLCRVRMRNTGVFRITADAETLIEVSSGAAEVYLGSRDVQVLKRGTLRISGEASAPAVQFRELAPSGNFDPWAGAPERRSRREPPAAPAAPKEAQNKVSGAVPVSVQIPPPLSAGRSFSVVASCGTTPRRDCAHMAKPVEVEICCGAKVTKPRFNVTPAEGKDATKVAMAVTLQNDPSSNDDVLLEAGQRVRVKYGQSRQYETGWEPVQPDPSEVFCCDVNLATQTVSASIPIYRDTTLTLRVSDANGNSKTTGKVKGVLSDDSTWQFIWPNQGWRKIVSGDTLTIFAVIDGVPQQIAGGPVMQDGPMAPPGPPTSGPPPSGPMAGGKPMPSMSSAPPPWVASTGSCQPPVVDQINGPDSVAVDLHCIPADPSQLVFYLDNVPQSNVTWRPDPGNRFLYQATLASKMKPFQAIKILEFSPAQSDSDSPVTVFSTTPAMAPAMTWVVPGNDPQCKPPKIAGALYETDSFQVQINCPTVDAANLVVYIDNIPQTVKWSVAGGILTATLAAPLRAFQRVKVLQFQPAQNGPDSDAVVVKGAAPQIIGNLAPGSPPPAAGNCAAPYLPNAPGAGDSVSVILGCLPSNPAGDLTLLINGTPAKGVTWSLTSMSPITYAAKLSAKLTPGAAVKVRQNNPPQRDPDSPSQTVTGPPSAPAAVFAVTEGATTVTGSAPGADKVRVQLVDGGKVLAVAPDATVDSTTNQFTATFTSPLQADQRLRAFGVSKTGSVSDMATATEVNPYGIDWGRVRGYFTAGVILSNNNSQFNLTNANSFVDFNVDKAWLQPQKSFDSIDHSFVERFRLHSFFDARLTAIPVGTSGSTAGSSPTLSGGSSASSGSTGTAGSSSSSTSTASPSVSPTSLLSNSQAAALQVGVYLPFVLDYWNYKDRTYSLYAAPIAKVGFYTLTSAGSSANQAAENAGRSSGTFFPFYSYGLRLGHYREYETWDGRSDRSRAPEQLSYLDISVGKWANYEFIQPFNFTPTASPSCTLPASDPTTAACSVRDRDWRYGFEGLLVVPNTPLILGLSANVAAQRPRVPGANFLRPPDDLRFLFGVRFDASKFTSVFGKLFGQ